MSGTNITKFIPNSIRFSIPTTNTIKTSFNTTYSNITTSVSSGNTFGRIVAYIIAIAVVLMVILLFIHFFIRPIFRLHPGDSGIITVPGFDDGVLFWNKGITGQINNKNTPIISTYQNYSVNMDIFIENPLQFSTKPRVIFHRGGLLKDNTTADTLLGIFEYYNLAVALLPDTNDLLISVENSNNNMENILIPNIPIQEPFRLGVILMENAMEVYLNGHLVKTRTFHIPPKNVIGDIYGPTGINANIFKVRNLKIWNRILTTGQIRYATPSLSTGKEFNANQMQGTSSCSLSSIGDKIENRIEKLSL
jgi:hypothetical protein